MKRENIKSEDFFEEARKIAEWYGFMPFLKNITDDRDIPTKKTKVKIKKSLKERSTNKTMLSAVLQFYLKNNLSEDGKPVLTYCSNVDKETKPMFSLSKKNENAKFHLTIVGIKDTIAEAMLLSCANNIIKNISGEQCTIKINSIGDKQSAETFEKHFKSVFRKKIDIIPAHCVDCFHKNYCDAYRMIQDNDLFENVRSYVPTTLKYLSDDSQEHLRSVLEYLDEHNLPYALSQHLIDRHEHCTHTIFEIGDTSDTICATGGRYDALSEHMFGKEVPITYLTITFKATTRGTHVPVKRKKRKAKIFFIHSGYVARLKSLPILYELKQNNIPIKHKLYCPKVSEQIEGIENFTLLLILGQIEAQEGYARVKNAKTKAYELVPFKNLPAYLKRAQNLQK